MIYICISWYCKTWWFSVKKCWCQLHSRGVSRDLYAFYIFFRLGRTVLSIVIVGYAWEILGSAFLPPPFVSSPEKAYPEKPNYWIQNSMIKCGDKLREKGQENPRKYNFNAGTKFIIYETATFCLTHYKKSLTLFH